MRVTNLHFFVALVAMLFALAGCGGAVVSLDHSGAAYAGNYQATYDRASGRLLVGLDGVGNVRVDLVDGERGYFTGTGTARQTNSFSLECTNGDGQTAIVSGTFAGSGASRSLTGTITGSLKTSYRAGMYLGLSNPFAGHYRGSFQGTIDLELDVDSTGRLTGDSNGMSWSGMVSNNGNASVILMGQGLLTAHGAGLFELDEEGDEVSVFGDVVLHSGRSVPWDGFRD